MGKKSHALFPCALVVQLSVPKAPNSCRMELELTHPSCRQPSTILGQTLHGEVSPVGMFQSICPEQHQPMKPSRPQTSTWESFACLCAPITYSPIVGKGDLGSFLCFLWALSTCTPAWQFLSLRKQINTQLSHSKPTSKLEDLHGNPLKAARTKGFRPVLGPALPGTTCPTWEKHSKHFTVSIFHSSSLVAGAVCLPCMHAGLLTEHVGLYGRVKPAIKDVLLCKISGMF